MSGRKNCRADKRCRMHAQRLVWAIATVFALALTACAGGSGSSGFIMSESAAINQALEEQRCVERDGLTICPADAGGPPLVPTSESTPTPTFTPTATPDVDISPGPSATVTPTAAASHTRTFTPTPSGEPEMRVDTTFAAIPAGEFARADCAAAAMDGFCGLPFGFTPQGFPVSAAFRVAVRTEPPDGPWQILAEPIASGSVGMPSFEVLIAVEASADTSGPAVVIQIAILVFLQEPDLLPLEVRQLADTGADFAFVLPEIGVQPEH